MNSVHMLHSLPSIRALPALLLTLVGVLACRDVQAAPVEPLQPGQAEAVFAGGCFWCMEADFEKLEGVVSATSGYAGGLEPNPTYEQVSAGKTGHTESVRVVYDPKKLAYARLVDWFFKHIDPTQKDGQFCDHGKQYRTALFYRGDNERKIAEAAVAGYVSSGKIKKAIVTELVEHKRFWPAEDYHQDYYKKNTAAYQRYRIGCGRDARVQEVWSPPQ